MGVATSVPECAKRYPLHPPIDCTAGSIRLGNFVSNPAITGIGTIVSFVLTAGLSLFFCGCVQICDRWRQHQLRRFFEPLVTSFSDQQIVRGLAMSIATLYTSTACSIDAYRYDILCYLMIMAIVSHLSSVLVLRSYTNGPMIVAVFRFMLVFTQVFFAGLLFSSRISGDFPTGIPSPVDAGNTTLVFPAVCFQLPDTRPWSGLQDIPQSHSEDFTSFSSYIILAIFYAISIVFTVVHMWIYYKGPRTPSEVRKKEEQARKFSWFWWLGVLRGIVLFGASVVWIWSVVKMFMLRRWMNGSGWMSPSALAEDSEMSFGQLISVLLLGAAPLSLVNAWSGYEQKRKEDKETSRTSDVRSRASGSRVSSGYFPYPQARMQSEVELQNLMK